MKKHFYIWWLAVLPSYALGQSIVNLDTVGTVIDDAIIESSDKTELNSQVSFIEGETGDTVYYGNGNIRSIVNHGIDGALTKSTYFPDGSLWKENRAKEQFLNGKQNVWWTNGNLKSTYQYEFDLLVGSAKEWYEDGRIKLQDNSCDTFRCVMTYYPSGQLESKYKTDLEGSYVGSSEFYCENGQLISITNHYSLVSNREFRYCNGSLWKKGDMYQNLVWIGDYVEYFEDGSVMSKGTYTKQSVGYESVKDGRWEYYDDEGAISKTELWVNGTKTEESPSTGH